MVQHAILYALSDLIECRGGLIGMSSRAAASAQLHGLAKVGIPDEILKNPASYGRL